jgi:hypothetical protein
MDILIVYSEYSKKCKQFISLLDKDPVIDINKFNKLCIDNPIIRNFFTNDKQLNIKKVPAVVVKTTDDELELYEGCDAFDWLNSFSQQLYDQLNEAEQKAEQAEMKKKAEIEERARQIALEQLKDYELKKAQEIQAAQSQQAPNQSSNVKQQAKIIAQDRSNLSFNDQINNNEKPDTGTHITQVKSSSENMSISDQVKQMEKERELEEKEIQKRRQMGMG